VLAVPEYSSPWAAGYFRVSEAAGLEKSRRQLRPAEPDSKQKTSSSIAYR
jgi:hypothetical protein